jgi:hypothetical protein
VVLQKPPLPDRERTDVHAAHVYPHARQRRLIGNRRDDEIAVPLEPDEPAVEQVVDARRQKEPVIAVQSLFVRFAIAPRLTVAGD